jgi:RNA polymerase sigma-70 factor (ECF subfamily)
MFDARALFEARLERYRSGLRLLARALVQRHRLDDDPSDLAQETLLEAHRDLEQFRGNTEQELSAWLRRILRNNIRDACAKANAQKRGRGRVISGADLDLSFNGVEELVTAPDSSPSERAAREEELYRLAEAIECLPEQQRQAVSLKDLAGLSLRDTAEQMNVSPAALAGLLYRGRQRLHELLRGTTDVR